MVEVLNSFIIYRLQWTTRRVSEVSVKASGGSRRNPKPSRSSSYGSGVIGPGFRPDGGLSALDAPSSFSLLHLWKF